MIFVYVLLIFLILFAGCRGKCLQLNFIVSILLLLVHGAWHSILAGFPPYGSLLEQYPIVQTIGYNLGLVSYVGIEPLMAVHYLAPEVRLLKPSSFLIRECFYQMYYFFSWL